MFDRPLAYDVELWAQRILKKAQVKLSDLYKPGVDGYPVITYLWARTTPCSNPTCRTQIPLLRTLLLCDKLEKKVGLSIAVSDKTISFSIEKRKNKITTQGTMQDRGDCKCPICGQITPVEDIRLAGLENKMSERMIAAVIDTPYGRDYRPIEEIDIEAFEDAYIQAKLLEKPNELILPEITSKDKGNISNSTGIRVHLYGLTTWGSLFNSRQIVAIHTLIDILNECKAEMYPIYETYYRNALLAYIGLWISRITQRSNSFCTWNPGAEKVQPLYGRQAIAMVWDYPEIPILSEAFGSPHSLLKVIIDFINHESCDTSTLPSMIIFGDAAKIPVPDNMATAVVTDPPYFDAISYADLSDFFYVWLKRALGDEFSELFNTPLTPKSLEATALKHRHDGNAQRANSHFKTKLAECLGEAKRICKSDGVLAIMFAHQSTEAWTALINALFEVGLGITATYPIDTEAIGALKTGKSVLSSSVTVICRPRQVGSAISLRKVISSIEIEVKNSVKKFWGYGFRGADLIVACYGPAIGVFGNYEHVEKADGTQVTIPELLGIVRKIALSAIAGEFTGDSISRLYFVWANLYGIGEQAWDDARMIVQIGSEGEDAMELARHNGLFVINGSTCRLALMRDRSDHHHLGLNPGSPLIDQLHYSMLLWKQEQRSELVGYLKINNLAEHEPFWKLTQALFEVLPHGEEDWRLISALLGERGTLKQEVRRSEPPKGPEQLPLI